MNADGNAGPGLRQTQIYDRLNGLMGIRAMKSWLLLLNTVCLAEKQQIPILLSLV
jgi:hypothetical protein